MNQPPAKIPSLSRSCSSCSAPFAPGVQLYSVMNLGEQTRRDLCASCFGAEERTLAAGHVHWKTRRPVPSRGEATVDLDSVTELFHRLLGDTRPEVEGLRYVVALLLVRKRRVKLSVSAPAAGRAAADDEEQQALMVVDPREGAGGAVVELAVPELSPEALERLKKEFLDSLTWNA